VSEVRALDSRELTRQPVAPWRGTRFRAGRRFDVTGARLTQEDAMRATTIAGIAFAAAARAHAPPEVLEADFGSSPDQTASVDVARTSWRAPTRISRAAKSKIAEARRERTAEADQAAAKIEMQRVKKLLEAAEAPERSAPGVRRRSPRRAPRRRQRRIDPESAKIELPLQALGQAKVQPRSHTTRSNFTSESQSRRRSSTKRVTRRRSSTRTRVAVSAGGTA
jgi:hypothetical protein